MHGSRWILTADERSARLLRAERTPTGAIHVAVEDEVQDQWEKHEHGRPAALSERPMPPGEYGGYALAPRGHEDETRRARFAKLVAVWLERRAEDQHIGRLAVFAPPRFLGALRDAWSARFAVRIDEHHGDLMYLTPGDLATHDAITRLMSNGSP